MSINTSHQALLTVIDLEGCGPSQPQNLLWPCFPNLKIELVDVVGVENRRRPQ
jgi:hypothetical protein